MNQKEILFKLVHEDEIKKKVDTVQLLADGLTRKEIAKKLHESIRTTEARIDKLRWDLDCKREAGLVALFFRNNLIK